MERSGLKSTSYITFASAPQPSASATPNTVSSEEAAIS